MTELIPPRAFNATLTVLVGLFSALWLVWDISNLAKIRRADRSDPLVRDRQFGYALGVGIATVGCLGVLKFYGVF